MKEAKDAEGQPLLDSTVVLFGSGMGNASSHSSRNLPILLAGGGFKPANIIGLSVPDVMGDRSVIYSSPSCNNWGWKRTGSPRVKVT